MRALTKGFTAAAVELFSSVHGIPCPDFKLSIWFTQKSTAFAISTRCKLTRAPYHNFTRLFFGAIFRATVIRNETFLSSSGWVCRMKMWKKHRSPRRKVWPRDSFVWYSFPFVGSDCQTQQPATRRWTIWGDFLLNKQTIFEVSEISRRSKVANLNIMLILSNKQEIKLIPGRLAFRFNRDRRSYLLDNISNSSIIHSIIHRLSKHVSSWEWNIYCYK